MWSALYPISNHSHIRQLHFATHAFSQKVLQQAVQISICQWLLVVSDRQCSGSGKLLQSGNRYTGCLKKMVIELWRAIGHSIFNIQK